MSSKRGFEIKQGVWLHRDTILGTAMQCFTNDTQLISISEDLAVGAPRGDWFVIGFIACSRSRGIIR